jgi:hypothetical protein
MPNGKNYWLHEANRKLVLALVGAKGKVRKLINEVIDYIDKHERGEGNPNAKRNNKKS